MTLIPEGSEQTMQMEDLILAELKSINEKLDSYTERTAVIETQIKPLFPNGQPGTLATLDKRITALEKIYWKVAGACATVSCLCVVVWEWAKAKLF